MENTDSDLLQQKLRIKEYFIDVKDDKFTNVRVVNCKQPFIWAGTQLSDCFMSTSRIASHSLELKIDYRHVEQLDSIYFVFKYENIDNGFAGMSNLLLYLILDDTKTLMFNSVSERDTYSDTIANAYGGYENIYLEQAQLSISTSDFIHIAGAKKIDFSIRFGRGKFDGTFTKRDLNIFKGFYNATFDDEFEFQNLVEFLNSSESKISPSKNNDGCYIATMTYGSYEHPKVIFLRHFRDFYLSNYVLVEKFIKWYYKYSPIWVESLHDKKVINFIIKKCINVTISIIKIFTSSTRSVKNKFIVFKND